MTGSERFDAIVIGSGQGGGPLANAFAQAGRKTALIEAVHVGGTCVNEGCTPTKTMVASGRVAYLARRAADYGVDTGAVEVDQAVIHRRTRKIVDDFRSGSERSIAKQKGLEFLAGEARFTGEKSLDVKLNDGATRTIAAEIIVIDTGARPAIPDLPGLNETPYLTSTTILELDETPEHLVIIGAGPIALEFGQMFRRFGSKVTILNRGNALLPKEDEDIAQAMTELFEQDGVTLLHNAKATSAPGRPGDIQLTVAVNGESKTVSGSHLLIATGRTPNTNVLDPAKAGVKLDEKGNIPVNARLETNVPGIYAIGDVNGGPAFTHISYDDFRILRANLLNGGNTTMEGRMVPWCIFTDPELGRIGLTETEANKQGEIKVAKLPMSSVARALEMDETRGLMKAVVDADSGKILGAAVLGVGGGELMTMIQLAMQGNLTAADLAHGVFAHPTLAESLNNLFSQITG
jgi:pyruvate/2-oxoglutarate dehydrogenase complex dihydrolipoamide dehydrogenase (E3) component